MELFGQNNFFKTIQQPRKKSKIHFANAEYTFEIESNNDLFTQDTLVSFPYLVKVFNAYYVKSVFSWDKETTQDFNPILFYLGDEAGDIQPQIDNYKNRWIPKIELIKKHYETIVIVFEEYAKDSGKLSKQATEIRKYLNDQIKTNEFNKSHFINLVSKIKTDLTSHTLTTDKITKTKQHADHPKSNNEDRLLPILTNKKMNVYLKEITGVCKINLSYSPTYFCNDCNAYKWCSNWKRK